MPLFEYKCEKCGHLFEKIEKHTASTTKKCPKCGAKAPRQFAAPAIQFKGSGWYVTDYGGGKGAAAAAAKESSGDGAAAKSGEKSPEKSGEKSSDTKPAPEKSSSKKDKK
ncbi:MAG: FmdB family zinc ribbon protein [Candidatus Acidiferrales bacterium]